jgi:peptide chain release factor
MNTTDIKFEIIYEQTGTTQRPGGQQAGMPAAAVRATHLPTGIMAQCGLYRSQHLNRKAALEMIEWALVQAGD